MLLRHTPNEVAERSALTINPAKTCQPIGAMYAALGIHGCLPHSHGSQGCCSYHRSTLTRHYKDPVMASTSSFTEGSSVFGGQANLLESITNIFHLYSPEVIAIHTTCLSETIGDDMPQIIQKAKDEGKIPEGKYVIHANTPSYEGSHVTGFSTMVKAMVDYFSTKTPVTEENAYKTKRVNVIPGWMEPADYREVKRLSSALGVSTLMFPDTSDVVDSPKTGSFEMYPSGGITVSDLRDTGMAKATIALGPTASKAAATQLEQKCGIPSELLELPIGIRATDRYVEALRRVGGVVPDWLTAERGRAVDLISDVQQYFYGKKVALWGDPDQLVPLSEFFLDLGMVPAYVVTGTPGKRFDKRMATVLGDRASESKVKQGAGADMFLMHQWIRNGKVDLLVGNTYGKYISRDEDIPLLRHGFPILDRQGHAQFPTVGYVGAMRLVERILGLFLDRKDRDSPERSFELVL
jgi:nitrogenase molybdenum-iron protein beta chain